jgi:hypothetical protein
MRSSHKTYYFKGTYGALEERAAKSRNISCSLNVQFHRLFLAQASHVRVTRKDTLLGVSLRHFLDVECRQEMFNALFFEVADVVLGPLIVAQQDLHLNSGQLDC